MVREALARLYADGVTITRRGAGTYVQRGPRRESLRLAPIGGVSDLTRCFEFRIGLEGEAASLAAQRRTEVGLGSHRRSFRGIEPLECDRPDRYSRRHLLPWRLVRRASNAKNRVLDDSTEPS